MTACIESGCAGTIAADGYCDTCGAKAPAPATVAPPAPRTVTGAPAAPGHGPTGVSGVVRTGAVTGGVTGRATSVSGRTRGSRRSSRRTGTSRAQLGVGLVEVPPTPLGDPAGAVMSPDAIAAVVGSTPEDQRVCAACGRPVGRTVDGRPGRVKGFCANCRTPFDFATNEPSLAVGELVGGQYQIAGCLAHGGLGWIYLASDTAVSNRWVVLKGLLNSNDADAVAAAVAERQYLARVEHGNIVRIYNFVTWRGAGYIVMEYVGGESLNQKLKARRRANGGVPDPLPLTEAIAYVLASMPALSHLHRLGLLYNDLKPANIMAVGDDIKLIDLGAVIRADDPTAIVFGTVGFQAPEVPSDGPSIASDIYTVGRTLAVLVLNFVFHEGRYEHALPGPEDEPLFAQWESFYRLLLRATAADPAERFAGCDELADQLHAVLREIVARTEGRPRPAPSARFSADGLPNLFARLGEQLDVAAANWRTLPSPQLDPADPATPFVAQLPDLDPQSIVRALDAAIADGRVGDTTELRLRRAVALVDGGADPEPVLTELSEQDPFDWRPDWVRGLQGLALGQGVDAADAFSRVWTELPGELAPKLGLALAAEAASDLDRAIELFGLVAAVDDAFVTAMFGLARCALARGDASGAVRAFELVPTTSAVYIDAQLAAARARVTEATTQTSGASPIDGLAVAAATVDRLLLDATTRAEIQAEILEAALHSVAAGGATSAKPGRATTQMAAPTGPTGTAVLFGATLAETPLRLELERTYRALARAAATAADRVRLVDQANAVRPRSLL
jgi:serine/threonine-protein kinase PknG